jgi:hypothetical protein
MLPEELRRPTPGQFGGLPIVYREPLLVAEAMFGVVAE